MTEQITIRYADERVCYRERDDGDWERIEEELVAGAWRHRGSEIVESVELTVSAGE